MSESEIDLIYFEGCPNAEQARVNLRVVLGDASWREWDLSATDTPERFRRYGSPTVLVDGRDVTGEDRSRNAGAMACRVGGAPPPDLIREQLSGRG